MQAKISIQLFAPDKVTEQSRDLKCVFVFANLHSYRSPDWTRFNGSKNQSMCTYSTTRLMRFLYPQHPLKYKTAIINIKEDSLYCYPMSKSWLRWAGQLWNLYEAGIFFNKPIQRERDFGDFYRKFRISLEGQLVCP